MYDICTHTDFSIHVPREGDDKVILTSSSKSCIFLSTSPARGTTPSGELISFCSLLFLSTSPARGTTDAVEIDGHRVQFSIHVPREGDDGCRRDRWPSRTIFYPRPPRGGRHKIAGRWLMHGGFLSTSPARGTTTAVFPESLSLYIFYPRPPRGGRPHGSCFSRRKNFFYPRPPRGGRQQILTKNMGSFCKYL